MIDEDLNRTIWQSRKRRSGSVVTTLLTAAALATLGGCSSDNTTTARCVGPDGRVLPDADCQNNGGSGYVGGSGYGGGGGGHVVVGNRSSARPQWVYGGDGGTDVGSRATNYSTQAPSEGAIETHSGTVIRGGFGGEGGSHAGGGGEGGGHGGGGGGE